MKLRHASGLAVGLLLVAAAASCNQPQRRNDWRSPSPTPTAPGDTPPPLLRGGDGGAPPAHPGMPNVQPSPNDIQI